MTLPNFIIIGAARSGTTALYIYLFEHPEVFVSEPKEPRFFAVLSGLDRIVGDDPDKRREWSGTVTTLEDYVGLFDGAAHEKAIGEASPIYLWSDEAAANIHRYLPDVKLIAILRHPVDRAFSHFLHNRKIGLEKNTRFEDALADDGRRHYADYLAQGHYFTLLNRYYAIFPAGQIRVFLYDELVSDAAGLMCSVYRFLGVDDAFTANVNTIHNASGLEQNRTVERLVGNRAYQVLMDDVLPRVLSTRVNSVVERARFRKPRVAMRTARELQKLFVGEIRALEELLGRDLTSWLERYPSGRGTRRGQRS